jgi:hypothetical protein
MEQKVMMTEQEVTNLKETITKQEFLINNLGSIEYQINILNTQKSKTLSEIESLSETQSKLVKSLEEKYGQGTIDLETGEFIKQ